MTGCAIAWLAASAACGQAPASAGEVNVATVLARVDDRAVMLRDVIGPIQGDLALMQKQLPREEYIRQERSILKMKTEQLIDRAVLLKEVDAKIKDDKRVQEIRKKISQEFDRHLLKVAREGGFKSKEDVLKALEKEGSNLDSQRAEFIDTILAREYLNQHIVPLVPDPTREETIAWHREHAQQFQQNAGVVWRHIEVRIGSDPKAAAEKIHLAQQRLSAGEDFGKVAKELSEEASAVNGGLCPLTSKGSYYEPLVDQALFTMPVGRFSAPIRGGDAFHIVKVEKRTSDGVKPFTEVQGDIVKAIKEERLKVLRATKMVELRKKHYIESIFDKPGVAEPAREKTIR